MGISIFLLELGNMDSGLGMRNETRLTFQTRLVALNESGESSWKEYLFLKCRLILGIYLGGTISTLELKGELLWSSAKNKENLSSNIDFIADQTVQ